MNKRIILIEDDTDARLLFKHVLTSAGYEVNDLSNGSSFMNASMPEPDLFILDNNMPTIDGIALTKYLKLKNHTRELPVMIVSGNPSILKRAMKAGAAAFVVKPFDVSEFLATVRRLLFEQEPTKMEVVHMLAR